ncbi:MAG: endo-1,4-beta-xylanase [Thermoguttaceae bacterium]|nr:endo-1,4-beta-xylanase [Thermoguttaceae bacterium]
MRRFSLFPRLPSPTTPFQTLALCLTLGAAAFGSLDLPPTLATAQETATSDERPTGELLFESTAQAFADNARKTRIGAISVVDEADGIGPVARCEVFEEPESPWAFSLRFPVDRPVQKGETLLLEFRARTVSAKTESGLGSLGAMFEVSQPPYVKSLDRRLELGLAWRDYSLPFRCVESRDAGGSAIVFFLGYLPQTVEIADVKLSSFGQNFDVSALRSSEPRYKGAEPDAPWRKAAQERIEQIRKGDLTLQVVDAAGKPIPNATVEIRQTRSAFGWGTAVVAGRILASGPDADQYRDFIAKYCNRAVFENDLKWFGWQNRRNRADVFRALDWLDERQIDVRGHCLVWPSWRNSTPRWKELASNPEALDAAIREHIRDEASALRGRVVDWDVVNEIHDNNDILKILGDDILVDWFQEARAADPNARLFINDYGILSGEGLDRRKQNSYFREIKKLLDAGAPIGGIGMQSHFGQTATPPERLLEILDRFAELGLPISITEHDVDATDKAFQAEFTRDFLTAAFSHPTVDEILIWGFWERSHWRPESAYFTANWTPTNAGKVWQELVGETWRSNLDATSNENGAVATRVFLGDYRLTVRVGDKTKTVETTVEKNAAEPLVVRFDD